MHNLVLYVQNDFNLIEILREKDWEEVVCHVFFDSRVMVTFAFFFIIRFYYKCSINMYLLL